mgnify:FL=1|tara:strand:- start:509 stop:1282 length:774 start_codon:yes stop_codon:yes gene_type:complete
MAFIAAAVIGSALVGGAVSAYSSNKASKAAGKASDEQIAFSKEMADRSRDDINKFLPQATDARNEGFQQQMNFLNKTLPTTMDMFQQGNVGAQNIIAGSMPQIQNAIMGGNVNYDFMKPQQINYQSQVQDLLAGQPTLFDKNSTSQQQPAVTPGNFNDINDNEIHNIAQNNNAPSPILNDILNPSQPANYQQIVSSGNNAMGGGFNPMGGGTGGDMGIGFGGSSMQGYRGNYGSLQPSTLPYNPTTKDTFMSRFNSK